jgi:hypothetical protein
MVLLFALAIPGVSGLSLVDAFDLVGLLLLAQELLVDLAGTLN